MQRLEFETSATPTILVEQVAGDLRLSGWDRPRLVAQTSADDLYLNSNNDTYTVRSPDDLTLTVPIGAKVILTTVSGDVRVKALTGTVEAQTIHGSLSVRQAGSLTLGTVYGELSAKQIDGALTIETCHGDLAIRDVRGAVSINNIHGSAYLRSVFGSVQLVGSHGAVIRLAFQPDNTYSISTTGDLTCIAEPGSQASFTLNYHGDLAIDDPALMPANPTGKGEHTFELNGGGAQVRLSANGSLAIITRIEADGSDRASFIVHPPDWEQLSEDITNQVVNSIKGSTAHLSGDIAAEIESSIRESLEGKLERANRKIERATQRSERIAQRAAERAKRAAERANRKSHRGVFFDIDGITPPRPPIPPMPPMPPMPGGRPTTEPVSQDERIQILRMLEEKKITLEQAEMLLKALEGDE